MISLLFGVSYRAILWQATFFFCEPIQAVVLQRKIVSFFVFVWMHARFADC